MSETVAIYWEVWGSSPHSDIDVWFEYLGGI